MSAPESSVPESSAPAAPHKAAAARRVAEHGERLLAVSHLLSEHPELGLEEVRAAAWLAEAATELTGRPVELGVGGLPTAFLATAGSGELVVTICAEYDALPEVGHGCGHNVIAAAALGAFAALAPLADELNATVRLLGTPAEENEGGKVTLLDAGLFESSHAALMVHPGPSDEASMRPYASTSISAEFIGREAHASLTPHRGLNALDALTVTLTAIGLARQQLEPGQQIHGTISGAGGAPNVIPGSAGARWLVRGTSVDSLFRAADVVERCAMAGGLASGCETRVHRSDDHYANMRAEEEITELYRQNAHARGRTPGTNTEFGGSTDMGNVSQRLPSIHPMIGLNDPTLTLHTAEFAAAAAGPEGDRAVLDGAMLLADTVIDIATTAPLRARLLSDSPFGE